MRQAIDVGSTQDLPGEVRRLFDRQAASRWSVAHSTAADRRKKLQRLRASLEKHRSAVAEGIRRDFGRSAEESELVEIHPSFEEINFAIARLASGCVPSPWRRRCSSLTRRARFAGSPRGRCSSSRLELPGVPHPRSPGRRDRCGQRHDRQALGEGAGDQRALRAVLADVFGEDEVAMVEGEVPVAEACSSFPSITSSSPGALASERP
jgi:hypothetical protein